MAMPQISQCNVAACSYNSGNLCHTPGINVGPHAECNTFNQMANSKGGILEVKGGIGACVASECSFNERLECQAPQVDVTIHHGHADCRTFTQRQ